MTPTRELELASALFWRLRHRDPEGSAMASAWRLAALNRARDAGLKERVIEKIDADAQDREAVKKGRCA